MLILNIQSNQDKTEQNKRNFSVSANQRTKTRPLRLGTHIVQYIIIEMVNVFFIP